MIAEAPSVLSAPLWRDTRRSDIPVRFGGGFGADFGGNFWMFFNSFFDTVFVEAPGSNYHRKLVQKYCKTNNFEACQAGFGTNVLKNKAF